ncbi:hypothetical protein Sste5346_005311 [Sporothrix stenoceras]|uniref:Penicillin-binding protein n=1 Tax=Sporothrix stenoceras TaxID=5173 RepID=A0ABR3Z5H4_9PEZI
MAHIGHDMQAAEDVEKVDKVVTTPAEANEEKPAESETKTDTTTETKTKTKTNPLNNADFEKLVRETLEKWHIQGVAVAVVDGDDTWAEGYGVAKASTDGSSANTPVTPSTMFYTGSTTKSFTAAAATLLVDDNEKYPQVQWTTPMNQLIREDFVLAEDYATSHVTLEDVLSNRSGLTGEELTLGNTNTSIRDYVRLLRHFTLSKEIRTTWQYCNGLFIAVGHMIEVVTGEAISSFLKRRIWGPLGMASTFWSLEDAKAYAADDANDSTLATPYGWDESAGKHEVIPYFEGVLGGAGAVISTVTDYAKYLRCIMRKTEPLSKAGHTALRTPRSLMPGMLPQLTKQMLYSLGWMLTTYHGEDVMLHPGGIEGMTATMILFPEREWGVLVFSNSDGPGRETLAWHLIDEMLEVPQDKRIDIYEKEQKKKAESKERNTKEAALKRLYPTVPSPPRPLSLSLEDYTGTYKHPAYPEFVVILTPEKTLKINVQGAFPVRIQLDHVSVDYFLASMFFFRYAPAADLVVRAEFELGVNSKVKRFGAALDFANMPDTLIWFDKVGEEDKKEDTVDKEDKDKEDNEER